MNFIQLQFQLLKMIHFQLQLKSVRIQLQLLTLSRGRKEVKSIGLKTYQLNASYIFFHVLSMTIHHLTYPFHNEFCSFCLLLGDLLGFDCICELSAEVEMGERYIIEDNAEGLGSFCQIFSHFLRHCLTLCDQFRRIIARLQQNQSLIRQSSRKS